MNKGKTTASASRRTAARRDIATSGDDNSTIGSSVIAGVTQIELDGNRQQHRDQHRECKRRGERDDERAALRLGRPQRVADRGPARPRRHTQRTIAATA